MKSLWFIFCGVLGGVLAGMGMGGGTLTIPLLVLVLGVGQSIAQTVNLVAFLPTGILALGVHFKNKLVDVKNATAILIPALLTSVLSSIFATDLDGQLLSKLFGVFLVVTAISSFFAQTLKKT